MNIYFFILALSVLHFSNEAFGVTAAKKVVSKTLPKPATPVTKSKMVPVTKTQTVQTSSKKIVEKKQPEKNKQLVAKTKTVQTAGQTKEHNTQSPIATAQTAVVKKSNRQFIDGVACRVNGPERSYIVCDSEKYKPGLAPISARNETELFEHFAFSELAYQDWVQVMERQKMDPFDNAIVNSYIDGLCRQNNWSMSDLEQVLSRSGFSLQEGIKELKKMYAVNYMTEMKMQTMAVPEEEIVAYYNAHPLYKEARVKAERAFVPYDHAISHEMQLNQLVEFAQKGTGYSVQWSTPCWFVENELAEHLKFIMTLQPPTISQPQETDGGFELYRIVINKPRAVISLKKRYKQIVAQLRQEKAGKIIEQYKKKLFDSASVVYFSHEQTGMPA